MATNGSFNSIYGWKWYPEAVSYSIRRFQKISAAVIMENAPAAFSSGKKFSFDQKGISLFTRSGGSAEGGKRSFDNIVVTQVPSLPLSNVETFEAFK